jgi:hypothetical protein
MKFMPVIVATLDCIANECVNPKIIGASRTVTKLEPDVTLVDAPAAENVKWTILLPALVPDAIFTTNVFADVPKKHCPAKPVNITPHVACESCNVVMKFVPVRVTVLPMYPARGHAFVNVGTESTVYTEEPVVI